MYSHNPIEILEKNKAKIVEERQIIVSEIDKFKKKLAEIDIVIDEYDAVIASAEKIHGVKEQIEELGNPEQEVLEEYEFIESHHKQVPKRLCIQELNGLTYGRQNDQITIRTPTNKHLNTTWKYLVEFYNNLPDITNYRQITGINKDKRFILMSFFNEHVNFNCNVVPDGTNSKNLVKEEVRVNTDTLPMQKMIDIL